MYRELGGFLRHIVVQRSLWKDGELWTAMVAGAVAGLWFARSPAAVSQLRGHFADVMTVTGIVFGFALTMLVLYVQAAGTWTREGAAQRVADKIVDWHVWTIVCLLGFLGYTILIWIVGEAGVLGPEWSAGAHGMFVFFGSYCGLQILNHTLTVWWTFNRRNRLQGRMESPVIDKKPGTK